MNIVLCIFYYYNADTQMTSVFFFWTFLLRPLLLLLLQDADTKVLALRKYNMKYGQIIWSTIDDYR